jgi:hypothetical protein
MNAKKDSLEIAEGTLNPASSSPDGPKAHNPLFVSSINANEPVVTRRELWAYYCTRLLSGCHLLDSYAFVKVYYNGDNVGVFSVFNASDGP